MPAKYHFFLLFLFVLLFTACDDNGENNKTWVKEGYEGKTYEKLAVVCVNEKRKVRKKFRKRIVRALKAKGIQAVSGKNIFPDGLTEADKDPEHMVKRLQSIDVDGILAVFIIREKTLAKKVVDLKGEGVYWVGNFLYRRIVIDQKDDEEIDDEDEDDILEYFAIETVLHDVEEALQKEKQTMVWRGECEITKDSTTKAAAQFFADSLAVQLVDVDKVVQ